MCPQGNWDEQLLVGGLMVSTGKASSTTRWFLPSPQRCAMWLTLATLMIILPTAKGLHWMTLQAGMLTFRMCGL
jgi:hypothetical protein